MHGLVEATKRAFLVRDRVRDRPGAARRIRPRAISTRPSSTPRPAKIDRRKAARWPAPHGRGRHGLDGRGGRLRPRRLLHPVALLGVRLRPACCRATGVLMQNRGASFSLERGAAEPAPARPPAVPHAQSGARRAEATAASWPTARWAATASRRSQAALFTRHVLYRQPLEQARRPAALAARAHLGLAAHEPAARIALR